MANFRRRRPRKQPASLLSSPDRVWDEPKENQPRWKKRPKGRKRFGIEERHIHDVGCDRSITIYKFLYNWRPVKWYHTEKQRDEAIEALRKSVCSLQKGRIEFRPCVR